MMSTRILPQWLDFNQLAEWRAWLDKNHTTSAGVWLKISKVHAPNPTLFLSDAVMEALCFGWIDGQMYSLGETSIITHFSPRKTGSVWSLVNRNRAEKLIAEGRMTEAGMEVIHQAKENGRWEIAYSSKEKPLLPENLAIKLRKNPIALAHFEKWSNDQQSEAIYWIFASKKQSTREERIRIIVERALNDEKK